MIEIRADSSGLYFESLEDLQCCLNADKDLRVTGRISETATACLVEAVADLSFRQETLSDLEQNQDYLFPFSFFTGTALCLPVFLPAS